MSGTTEAFWEFSLKVWQNEDLRHQLLQRQEQDDLDINLCLFLLWNSTFGFVLDDAKSKITQRQGEWLYQTIKPIRAIRITNHQHPQLKQALLAAELEAEKCYQEALCAMRTTVTSQKAPADNDTAATLRANLESYTQIFWDSELIELMIRASQ